MKINKDTIGLAIGILSIVVSISFYFQNKKHSSIALLVDPLRVTFITNNAQTESERIKIYYDSIQIESNLHSLFFYLYNNGGLKISENEIRKPIEISLGPKTIIHEFRIIKITHSNTKFEIEHLNNQTIQLDFKELYPNDGIAAQIIYEGEKDSQLLTTSNIVGIDRLSNIPISSYSFYLYVTLCSFILIILFILYFRFKAKITAETDELRAELMEEHGESGESDEIDENTKKSNPIFNKIMNIIGPIIVISMLLTIIIFLAYGITYGVITSNPEWFIPELLEH